jgi:hypothetical protein
VTSRLDTDFNVSPWFDDFESADTKNYHRILFKPTVAVQARELTQLQSILQEQVARFGSYMFKDGSIVDRCAITYIPNYPVVYVENQFDSNTQLSILDIPTNYLLVSNSGVRAAVSTTKSGFELTYPETNRFYVNYIYTGTDGSNNDVTSFQSGEKLYVYNANQNKFGALLANNLVDTIDIITSNGTANATGTAYGVQVSDGIVFQKGFFINVNEHTIPVRDHDTSVNNYVVGFNTAENVVTSTQDPSILSNAAGFPNYNAPGADRLQLTASLVSKPKSDTANSTSFFAIVEFDSDSPTQTNNEQSGLNQILDVLASRTNEESGDYTVKPFTIDTSAYAANTQQFQYNISTGIMYVKGYRIEKLNAFNLVANKATSVRQALNQIVTGNYGNYVLVNELVGSFDYDHLSEVTLYDAAQLSITQNEDSSAGPAGNAVGLANVLGLQYDSGVKGSPLGQYRFYLFNVRMNSGKSFANDVKSIYGAQFSGAKADVVLTSNTAVIQSAASTSLVFPFGVDAVKRLRNSLGGNETSFVFRDIASATMASNGVVTFTTNSPANGGQERLNASVGVLSSTLASNFNIITAASTGTANLTGTLSYANTTNVVTGTGTSFTTQFVVGDTVMIQTDNTPSFQLKLVTLVSNNTSMRIASPIALAANTAAAFRKYYMGGHVVNLADFGGSITVLSNTQFTVDTNLDLGAGNLTSGGTVYAQYPVLRSQAVATGKQINKSTFVKIDCSNNVGGTSGPWDLGVVDVAKVRNVYVGTTYANTNPERSSWFTYDNGQKDNFYDHGKLIVKTAYKSSISAATKMLVELDFFTANTTTGVGFFSVDSYPIDDANTANVNAIQTAEIPQYFSSSWGQFIDLRNSVDFRPRKYNTANVANSSAATINPPLANSSFNAPATGGYVLDADTNFMADLEYYLPRRDLVVINKLGEITSRVGEPNEYPIAPINEDDTAVIAESYITPYPSLSSGEAVQFNRSDLEINVDIKTNRVYTEKDIGTLDTRITRLEYYAALSLLEQKAQTTSITDSNGLDRFKNGIFADSFDNSDNGKTSDIEYSIAIDSLKGVARPNFVQHNIDFAYRADLSSSVTKTGHLITAPYTHELFVDQRYATNTRNATGAYWAWNGKLNLYPTYDYFTQEIDSGATLNVTQDLTTSVSTGTTYGDWRTVASSTSANSTSSSTTTTAEQVITTTTAQTVANTISTGKYVTAVTENTYVRSREVAFIATGMKPNTTMHVFFDNKAVDAYCAPATPSGLSNFETGSENKILNRTGNYGAPIKSDSSGNVYGMFKIPDSTFLNGDRELIVTNVTDLVVQAGSILTEATALYTASSISVTTGSTTLTTLTTEINSTSSIQTRSSTQTTTITPAVPNRQSQWFGGGGGRDGDPIAQSFTAFVPSNVSGMFVTKVGVYFSSKDAALGCSVYIVETSVGLPDSSRFLGRAYLTSAEINTSTDATAETQFTFVNPVYLENGKDYAFMVKPDGNSPEYNLWISEIGNYDVITGEQVYSNPYSGMLFVSANMTSWTANQTEDMKFRLYRANFTTGTGTAVFTNEDDEFLTVGGITSANSSLDVEVGDYIVKVVGGVRVTNTANVNYAAGRVQTINEAVDFVQIDSSNGNLEPGDVIEFHRSANSVAASFNANTLVANTTIVSTDDASYNAIVPRFAAITPALTSLTYRFNGTNSSYQVDANTVTLSPEVETELLDYTRIVASKSNEVDSMASAKSAKFTVSMTTSNIYVSPVIDLRRKAGLMIENVINNDATNEYTRYGAAVTKYVSKNVVLDDAVGNAEDALVYIGAYRPAGTDVQVYVKVLGSDDGEAFDDKLWTRMPMTSGSSKLYSSPIDVTDYREFQYGMPTSVTASVGSKTTAYLNNGVVQYARSDGALIVGYKTFCFKVVLLSDNSAKVPRLADFRAIALQV